MPQAETMALRDRIIDEIEGMAEMSRYDFVVVSSKYTDELEVESPPLVISPSWQAAYDE